MTHREPNADFRYNTHFRTAPEKRRLDWVAMGNASRGGKGRFGFGVALSLLLVAHCATLRPALALVQEKDDGSKAFDLEYGQHIVDFNTVVYCPDGREIESWTCPTCRKNTTKNFQVDQVIHEFEINIQAYTGYSPTLGTFGHIQPTLLLTKPLPPAGADDATSRFLACFLHPRRRCLPFRVQGDQVRRHQKLARRP